VGFSGGLVVDYPHSTRAKKYFLVLMVGASSYVPQAKGLEGEEPEDEEMATEVAVTNRQRGHKQQKRKRDNGKGKAWIFKKKEQMRKRGHTSIPVDTKYTGRKRRKVV
jgi:18S rRNA (guanine1575-N7)-methyltransferase